MVTLDKSRAEDRYAYVDHFDGRFFQWESQKQQSREWALIRKLVSGEIEPLLFVRIRDKDRWGAAPYFYCGRLRALGEPEGDHPVKIRFECKDYNDDPSAPLAAIYAWRPGSASGLDQATPRKGKARKSSHQGRQLDPKTRRAIERYAMDQAIAYYEHAGFSVEDTSANASFDLFCRSKKEELRVEVKGTTSGLGSVIVTDGEVCSAREHRTDLFIVHSMIVRDASEGPMVESGAIHRIAPWDLSQGTLQPTQYRYSIAEAATPAKTNKARKRRS